MWRWRTLVRQLCVGPRAHGLIGTYQVSPQTIHFLQHVVIMILLLHTIFNRFCLRCSYVLTAKHKHSEYFSEYGIFTSCFYSSLIKVYKILYVITFLL